MKANWYYVHSLDVCQMVLVCYYLLGATLQRRAGYTLGFATHF